MKIKFAVTSCVFFVVLFFSCAGQNNAFVPVPDFDVFVSEQKFDIDNIIETKNGSSAAGSLPEWLLAFAEGGIKLVEQLESFRDKYVFVAANEGENFIALNKWAENFTAVYDLAILAAIRIEERMILNASLYPDYEYGLFYENLMKIAYGTEYRDAVKEGFFWFKRRPARDEAPEIFNFFILLTIDKNTMQSIIRNMMAQASAAAPSSRAQGTSINRLRQAFFEDF